MAAVEGFNHHGITVRSVDRALDLFVGVLGFRRGATVELDDTFTATVTGVPGSRLTATFVHGPGVDVELLRYERADDDDRGQVPNRPGSSHLALFVDDIDRIAAEAGAGGWRLAGGVADIASGPRAGGRAAYLRDPDGVTVELVQRPS